MTRRILNYLLILVLSAICVPAQAQFTAQQTYVASSTGTNSIAITVPNVLGLSDLLGVPLRVYVSGTNTGATTLTVNSLASTAVEKPTTAGLAALIGGEIVANQINTFVYDTAGVFELVQPNLNLATVSTNSGFVTPTNMQISCAAAANALTCALKSANTGLTPTANTPIYVPFDTAPTIGGAPVWRTITGAVSTTIAGGNNMGCSTSGNPCRLWITLLDNAGTELLGLSDQSSPSACYSLNEGVLQTSGAGTSGGNSINTIYTSASSVGPVAIRIIGYVEWTSIATAGDWTAPNFVQIFGSGIKKPCDIVQGPLYATGTSQGSSSTTSNVAAGPAVNITPQSYADLIMADGKGVAFGNTSNTAVVQVFRAAGASAACTTAFGATATSPGSAAGPVANVAEPIGGIDFPAANSELTYSACVKGSAGGNAVYWCYQGVTATCTLTLWEIQGKLERPINDNGDDELRMAG